MRTLRAVPDRLPLLRSQQIPFHPLLLALYAVLFLFAENLGEVPTTDLTPLLGRAAVGSVVLFVVLAILFRSARRGAIVASAAVVAFFAFGHVSGLLEDRAVDEQVQLLAWLIFIGLAGVLAVRLNARLASVTSALNILSAVLVGLSLFSIVPYEAQAAAAPPPPRDIPDTRPDIQTSGPGTTRDIYYLVFDRYGSSSSLEAGFGIADNDLYGWLADRGFHVAAQSHANYIRTSLSLAATLNMEYLDDIAERMGPESKDLGPIHQLLQSHAVGRFLRSEGYRYVHIGSWFGPTKGSAIADENPQWDTSSDFELTLYETTALPVLEASLGREEVVMPPEDLKHVQAARFAWRTLEAVRGKQGPKFVFAHILLPHDPYVFDAAGTYIPKEERKGQPIPDQFRGQLQYTNDQIKGLVERLLSGPEENRPIVIIQADEGPYPARFQAAKTTFDWGQATPEELEEKYGILNAMYLPGLDGEPGVYPTMTSVNTFRLVLGRYFGADLPLLPDRTYTSRAYDRPYAFTDVTERLAAGR